MIRYVWMRRAMQSALLAMDMMCKDQQSNVRFVPHHHHHHGQGDDGEGAGEEAPRSSPFFGGGRKLESAATVAERQVRACVWDHSISRTDYCRHWRREPAGVRRRGWG